MGDGDRASGWTIVGLAGGLAPTVGLEVLWLTVGLDRATLLAAVVPMAGWGVVGRARLGGVGRVFAALKACLALGVAWAAVDAAGVAAVVGWTAGSGLAAAAAAGHVRWRRR